MNSRRSSIDRILNRRFVETVHILGIETSCDETAAAVMRDGTEILSNVVSSQVALHEKYGGVVPELASRKHMENILPVIDEALRKAAVSLDSIKLASFSTFVGRALEIQCNLVSSSREEAKKMAEFVRGITALSKMTVAKERPEWAQFLDDVDIDQDGEEVNFSLILTKDFLDTLQKEKQRLNTR